VNACSSTSASPGLQAQLKGLQQLKEIVGKAG
jgi:hypothetical protein